VTPSRADRWGACATILIVAMLGTAAAAEGAPTPAVWTSSPPFQARAAVRPTVAELGERVVYRASVTGGTSGTVRWLAPDSSALFTWGAPTREESGWWRYRPVDASPRHPYFGGETVEVPLQAFALGRLSVPGIQVEIDTGSGSRMYRLPGVTLTVVPVLTAADSNARFRAVHGPLVAPWWERVPWTPVLLGLLVLAVVVALVAWWRRRRRHTLPVPVESPVARDPQAVALAALADLRRLNLPEQGRFAEHAFRLGQILRRYLESIIDITRPGDTTPELVAHLQTAVEPEDLKRLAGLLRVWDRVKFALEPFTLEEAIRAERTTEAFLRRPPVPAEKVA